MQINILKRFNLDKLGKKLNSNNSLMQINILKIFNLDKLEKKIIVQEVENNIGW